MPTVVMRTTQARKNQLMGSALPINERSPHNFNFTLIGNRLVSITVSSCQFKNKTPEWAGFTKAFGRLALESTYFGSNRGGEMEQSRYPLGV